MRHPNGFTLVEMSIVLVIVAVLIGGLMVPLRMQVEINNINTAKREINEIKESLLGFLVANHRLPCPGTKDSYGAEYPVGGGNCDSQYGFLPAASLGISGNINQDGLLLDPWGSPYRYIVSNSDRSIKNVDGSCNTTADSEWDLTTKDEISSVGVDCLNVNLKVCRNGTNSATCDASKLINDPPDGVPAIVFSMGKNWAQTLTAPTSPHEMENVGNSVASPNISGLTYLLPDDMQFVSAPYNSGSTADRFDDIVDWISPNILYNRMVMAGIYP